VLSRNYPAKTSSFPLCPDHRPGPTLLKNSHSRSSQKFHRAMMPVLMELGEVTVANDIADSKTKD
jgi:hypothetical protein